MSTSEVAGLRASTCISYFLHSDLVAWFNHPFLLLPSFRLQHIKKRAYTQNQVALR